MRTSLLSLFTAILFVACGSSVDTDTPSTSSTGTPQTSCIDVPDEPYDACTGTTLFPDGSCEKGSCVTDPLTASVFAEWKTQALALSGLDENTFWQRVQINSVEKADGPVYVFVSINAVITVGWSRTRVSTDIQVGEYPLASNPTPAQIQNAVKLGLYTWIWQGVGELQSVAPLETLAAGFAECSCALKVDYCHGKFDKTSGRHYFDAIGIIDQASNKCIEGRVYADTGESFDCKPVPCEIN